MTSIHNPTDYFKIMKTSYPKFAVISKILASGNVYIPPDIVRCILSFLYTKYCLLPVHKGAKYNFYFDGIFSTKQIFDANDKYVVFKPSNSNSVMLLEVESNIIIPLIQINSIRSCSVTNTGYVLLYRYNSLIVFSPILAKNDTAVGNSQYSTIMITNAITAPDTIISGMFAFKDNIFILTFSETPYTIGVFDADKLTIVYRRIGSVSTAITPMNKYYITQIQNETKFNVYSNDGTLIHTHNYNTKCILTPFNNTFYILSNVTGASMHSVHTHHITDIIKFNELISGIVSILHVAVSCRVVMFIIKCEHGLKMILVDLVTMTHKVHPLVGAVFGHHLHSVHYSIHEDKFVLIFHDQIWFIRVI